MQVDDTVFCHNCNSKILKKCQLIHSFACNNKKSQHKQKRFIDKLFGSNQEKQQMIPCLQCGESFPFSTYAIHQKQCVGHQLTKCASCQILFPTFLFDQHLQVCQGPKNIQKAPVIIKKNQQIKKEKLKSQNKIQIQQILNQSDQQQQQPMYMMIAQLAKKQFINDQKLTQEPLKQNQLKTLKQFVLNTEEQCSICCCQMNKKTNHIRLNCKHVYHKKCIFSWLGKNPYCPMCRQHALKK